MICGSNEPETGISMAVDVGVIDADEVGEMTGVWVRFEAGL